MSSFLRSGLGATAVALALAATQPAIAAGAAPAATADATPSVTRGAAAARADAPTTTTNMSVGRGTLITLPTPMTDVFVADDKVADVQVRSPTQLWVFGRAMGETSIYATNRAGAVLWSSQVRVAPNLESVSDMLKAAVPDGAITVTPMNGAVLLTGTAASPDDVAEATRLAQQFLGDKMQVLTRIRTATPLQVSLHVRIAEVSRTLSKSIGMNLLTRDNSGGVLFGIAQGTAGKITTNITDKIDESGVSPGGTNFAQNAKTGATTLGLAGRFLGMDVLSTLDLAETDGLAVTLAEPNLTALSGETASFLAGGEIPVPQASGLGATSVSFKQYGVSLAFTPIVLSDGRISLRVRPEVSQLTNAGAVTVNNFTIPALTTRRAETTVELGSGQSFVIGGLLQNNHNNSTDKAPFLGDLPILGALFRSNSFKKDETELVIVVTPYLVRPVDAARIALPTDGYRAATDASRVLGGQPVAKDADAPPRPGAAPAPIQPTAANIDTAPAHPAPSADADPETAPIQPGQPAEAAQSSAPPGPRPLAYEPLELDGGQRAAAAPGPRK